MGYRCRPGIIRIKICGENMLVPTRAASEECPRVMRLSVMGAMLWEEILKGNDGSAVIPLFHRLTRKPEAEIQKKVEALLYDLHTKGFLLKTPEDRS